MKMKVQVERKNANRLVITFLITIAVAIFFIGFSLGGIVSNALAKESVNQDIVIAECVAEPTEEAKTEQEALIVPNLDKELQLHIVAMCEKHNVPLALALAVMEQESAFNPDAVSLTNDYGLMQINTINFAWLRKRGIEPLDYKDNIEAGVLILSNALNKSSNVEKAVVIYKRGESGAKGITSTECSKQVMQYFNKWNEIIERG